MSFFTFFTSGSFHILNNCKTLCLRNLFLTSKNQKLNLTGKTLQKLGIPSPPKRPVSPYLRFLQNNRPKLILEHPNLTHHEVIKLIAKEWSSCDLGEKKLLQQQYQQDMQAYSSLFKKYKESITPEQLNLIQKAKEKQKRSKDLARVNEKKQNLGKPKKPLTAFINFMLEKKSTKDVNLKYPKWLKEVAKEWANINEESKEKYREKSRKELEQYKSDLIVWEENMIRQGHVDVVRNKELLTDKPLKKN